MTRIFVVAIDGTSEDMIFEQPGYWTPMDWSPDGKKLLLTHGENINSKLSTNALIELDMATVEKIQKHLGSSSSARQKQFGRWQNSYDTKELLDPVLSQMAPVWPNDARYSPDGKFIAMTAIRKAKEPGAEWKELDELGVIDRATATYRKVGWYKDGLHGPICWSPDSTEILFSRPLKAGDKREVWREEGNGLGVWAIKTDGTGERFVTTGWSPDWR